MKAITALLLFSFACGEPEPGSPDFEPGMSESALFYNNEYPTDRLSPDNFLPAGSSALDLVNDYPDQTDWMYGNGVEQHFRMRKPPSMPSNAIVTQVTVCGDIAMEAGGGFQTAHHAAIGYREESPASACTWNTTAVFVPASLSTSFKTLCATAYPNEAKSTLGPVACVRSDGAQTNMKLANIRISYITQ
jgi:hypothetical protein